MSSYVGPLFAHPQPDPLVDAVSPYMEMGAFEALWNQPRMTFKKVADLQKRIPGSHLSQWVEEQAARNCADRVLALFNDANLDDVGFRVHGTHDFPDRLNDAINPLPFFYFKGRWDLASTLIVSVIGTRKPSPEGILQTSHLVEELVRDDYTIASGLAAGIDTAAHKTAINSGGRTIAVLGTPLTEAYPKQNKPLQDYIGKNFLLVSQVPVLHYNKHDYRSNRKFFPERNLTMSALSEASIIVEASETSGTLIQARAALRQGRKLFILDHCFRNKDLLWPEKYVQKGAIRVNDYSEIRRHLGWPDKNR